MGPSLQTHELDAWCHARGRKFGNAYEEDRATVATKAIAQAYTGGKLPPLLGSGT